jgi:hypothetical protein
MSSIDYKRCSGICDGASPVNDGFAVFAPNATLNNSDTATTADIPWHGKFTGSFAPYSNDQHPFLTWNIFRISSDGQIEHIGRSGVKHAFLTLNNNCSAYDCGDSYILWRQCSDVYSSGNNDATTALGPRSEIVPAQGIWARCGSIYDKNCDGVIDSTSSLTPLDNRLLVQESKLADTANYQYFYEGWYVVRQDTNIYNTMGNKQFTPSFSTTWRSVSEQAFQTGPVIDRWVNPTNPGAGNMSTEVVLPDGHLKVAVRTKLLPNGNTRYDYAVMNLDYLSAKLDNPNSLNPRMISSAGISGLSVPSNAAAISAMVANVGSVLIQDWNVTRGGSVRFSAPTSASELRWSSLYSFSFESNTAPIAGQVTLSGAGLPDGQLVNSLVPGPGSEMLVDDFE